MLAATSLFSSRAKGGVGRLEKTGVVTITSVGRGGEWGQSGTSCGDDGGSPLRCRFGSEYPRRGPRDEMPLKVERVVNRSMHIEKALGRGSRLEPLHFTLSPSHGLMGVFGAIVRP